MLKKKLKAVCVSVAAVIVLAVLAWIIYGFTLCDISDDGALATHIVSDIECIADRVILLKGGVKIGEDTPEGLMESIAEKVFEVKGEREELIELQRETGLGNIMHNQNGLALRVVTDEPKEYYTPVKGSVSLEDVYLYYFEYLKTM